MNFLAHARASLEQPWLLAGVCLPDWLRVVHRRARVDVTRPHPRSALPEVRALRSGVERHVYDDGWFHASPVFVSLNERVAARIRADQPGARGSFYGHILIELLLDAVLMERDPSLADRFYAALDEIDGPRLAEHAAPWLKEPARVVDVVPPLLERFRELRFIERYGTDEGVLRSLRGVTTRVHKRGRGLKPLPDTFTGTIAWARAEVREAAAALLEEP